MNALLIGEKPPVDLGYEYTEKDYDAVVIGSLGLGALLRFSEERVLSALAAGKPVLLYTPGLPTGGRSRGLNAAVASAKRTLKSWGVEFTDGTRRRLITAEEARALRVQGRRPGPGAVLTPLARDILEGME